MKHPIPDEALDDRLAFIGTSGSGKSSTAPPAL
jgi:ABC-type dipeptide/oligopeptide/nickel transport system ATPase component